MNVAYKGHQSLGLVCSRCQSLGAHTICKCGICVYHKECASVTTACNCGFPMKSLLTIGEECIACLKKDSNILCHECSHSFVGILKGISKKGLSLNQSGSTCQRFMSSTSMIHPSISDPSATVLCNTVIHSMIKKTDFLCIYNQMVHRVEDAMTLKLLSLNAPTNIETLAREVHPTGDLKNAVQRFKTLHWEHDHGILIKKDMAKISNSSVDIKNKSSLIKCLQGGATFQALKPILESWSGASSVIRNEHKHGRVIIMDQKYVLYTDIPDNHSIKFKDKWYAFISKDNVPE